jgi:signal transduction histidine kinase
MRTLRPAAGLIPDPASLYAAQERVRLARDLHDGVLQFLAGISLQVQTLHRLADDCMSNGSVRPP